MSINKALIALALGLALTACKNPPPHTEMALVCTSKDNRTTIIRDVGSTYSGKYSGNISVFTTSGHWTYYEPSPSETCAEKVYVLGTAP